jgi:MFS family permease
VLLVLSLFLQLGLRFSPEHAGLTFAPMSLGVAIAAGGSFPLIPKFGRKVLQAGMLVVIAGLATLALTVDHAGLDVSSWSLVPGLLVFGLGMGLIFGPLFQVILAGVADDEVGSASGTLNAVQQLSNAAGVAVLATIFFSIVDHGHTSASAMTTTAVIAAGLFVAAYALSFLLPREARPEEF